MVKFQNSSLSVHSNFYHFSKVFVNTQYSLHTSAMVHGSSTCESQSMHELQISDTNTSEYMKGIFKTKPFSINNHYDQFQGTLCLCASR